MTHPDFVAFVLPDGRKAYVRRHAVVAVYDQAPPTLSAPEMMRFDDTQRRWIVDPDVLGEPEPTCVVHTASTAMPVPYTAEQAMEILYGEHPHD